MGEDTKSPRVGEDHKTSTAWEDYEEPTALGEDTKLPSVGYLGEFSKTSYDMFLINIVWKCLIKQ